ncbi:MAG: DUF805 domain-containing protein [Burkholderiaceae bacterium]|jgi:uncharacterized membrane protein YhaH (DUF805 family)|nr:DUF805 domain-containing protein [Burkholderiaceae bacterium]MEB2317358.1 DUF805 domain-containing protein [Pseudomonadota bacterium]
MEWFMKALRQYAVFTGRARRKEYWFFVLFYILIAIGLGFIDSMLGLGSEEYGLLSGLFGLAMLLPALGVAVRRMHDTGRSGWWVLVSLIPFIGWLIFIWFATRDGEPGPNAYGPDPKTEAALS